MLFNQHQGPILFVTIDKNAQSSTNNLYEDEDLADHINHLHKTKQKIKFNVINHPQENNPLQIEKRLLITKTTTVEHLYLYDQQITQYPSGNFDFITAAFNLILHNNYKDISLSCQNESLTLTASITNLS